ncbi:MAG: hypothetical protein CMD89_03315 [Gammaproteobacteria bacterium]|nr:hypothetical protein [Gammaproteobacteria bacterium]|tara:strand:+ start:65511 stop:65936 length:426 start_codon:yes stop_codon:yes gene_type:complete
MKNLARFKDKVNARNLLVQAMYEFSFGHNAANEIEESFIKNYTKTKVDYIFFKNIFRFLTKSYKELQEKIKGNAEFELFGIKTIEKMEQNILLIALAEAEIEKTPKNILLDESVRLAKKFGAENSYKFVNASLEKILESYK